MNTPLEWLAVGLGLLYLLGAVQQRRSCWIAGGISAVIFAHLFHEAELPMQALLQLYYVVVAVHGWWHWGSSEAGTALPVQRWLPVRHAVLLLLWAAASAATLLLREAPLQLTTLLDTVTTWGSLLATWLVARKVLENWLYWIVIDAAAVVLYAHSGLTATAGLYLLYTIIAVVGWFRWRQTYRHAN